LAVCASASVSQAQGDYILGEERRLEIVVHVLGEVTRPGELRVNDNTNVLEALSKAGGGTQYANLNAVTLTRLRPNSGMNPRGEQIIHVNIADYLRKGAKEPLPMLEPGDVISVPRNNFSRWKTAASIIRDLSIVATTYFLYLRTTR
jgi:protein involved in polysaccharide export with SLBB domain